MNAVSTTVTSYVTTLMAITAVHAYMATDLIETSAPAKVIHRQTTLYKRQLTRNSTSSLAFKKTSRDFISVFSALQK